MKLKFIILYIVTIITIFLVLNMERESKLEQFLNEKTKLYQSLYEVHYHNYQKESQVIYDTLINNDKIKDIYKRVQNADDKELHTLRNELYNSLANIYNSLQYTKLKQLHFHLKNNDSFLRMHKPNKFGDNLTIIRETVAYVNKEHKMVDSFEMGRVYSGLRFVFPITAQDKQHLGSVEISFDISVFTLEFMEHFGGISDFYFNQEILFNKTWDKYIKEYYEQSSIQGYFLEKRNTTLVKEYAKSMGIDISLQDKTSKKLIQVINSGKAFTRYDKKSNLAHTYLPIKNKVTNQVVGFFVIKSFAKYVKAKMYNFYFIFFSLSTLILIILYLLYLRLKKSEKYKSYLQQKINDETKELQKSRKELVDKKNFLDTLIQTAPIPIFYKDIDGNYVEVNKTWCDFTGFTKEEIIGKSVFDVAPKDIAQTYKDQDQKVYDLVENPQIYESQVVNKYTKKVYEVIFYKSAVFNNEGNVVGIIGSVVDLTETKKFQKEALDREKTIQENAKFSAMGDMITNIAHQWRQPLSVIGTLASGMQLKHEMNLLADGELDKAFETINENTQYLSQTIESLNKYMERDSRQVAFDLNNDTKEFLNLINLVVKKHNITMILDLEEHIQVKGYPSELIQCFMNIFNNAKDVVVKNAQDERYVFISQHIKDGHIVIEFKDNGGGVPDDIINQIFDPYFTTKHQSQGTGLGLSLSYNLVKNVMHGSLECENVKYHFNNKEYTGALFRITLPLA